MAGLENNRPVKIIDNQAHYLLIFRNYELEPTQVGLDEGVDAIASGSLG
jgi:hypothetical protein